MWPYYLVDWFRAARDTTKSQFCATKSVLCTVYSVPAGNLNIFIVSVYTHYVKCVLLSIFQVRELTFWDLFTLKMESKCGLLLVCINIQYARFPVAKITVRGNLLLFLVKRSFG
jgi:hypothetical protein